MAGLQRHDTPQEEAPRMNSGTIVSEGGSLNFSYKADVIFPLSSELPSFKCKTCPGPLGPQTEIRRNDEETPCATIRDSSKPFDDMRTMQICIPPSTDAVDAGIVLCIAADIMNDRQVLMQKARKDEMFDCFCCYCCDCFCCCCCECLLS